VIRKQNKKKLLTGVQITVVDGIYHCNFTPGSSFFTRCSNSARLAVDFYTQSSEVNSSKYAAVPQAKSTFTELGTDSRKRLNHCVQPAKRPEPLLLTSVDYSHTLKSSITSFIHYSVHFPLDMKGLTRYSHNKCRSIVVVVATVVVVEAKFHYAILVADRSEAGRRQARSWSQTCSELKFGPSSSSLAAS